MNEWFDMLAQSGFWIAVFGGLLYGLISWLLSMIIPFGKKPKAL